MWTLDFTKGKKLNIVMQEKSSSSDERLCHRLGPGQFDENLLTLIQKLTNCWFRRLIVRLVQWANTLRLVLLHNQQTPPPSQAKFAAHELYKYFQHLDCSGVTICSCSSKLTEQGDTHFLVLRVNYQAAHS